MSDFLYISSITLEVTEESVAFDYLGCIKILTEQLGYKFILQNNSKRNQIKEKCLVEWFNA